jgi:hypothetical protein
MVESYNTLSGGPEVTMGNLSSSGGNGPDRPATGVNWNAAARFVNWLNTSQGYSPAYKFTNAVANSDIVLWSAGETGYDAANPFRNSDAHYFLPSENEWYKAAYFDPSANSGSGGYWDYAIGSDTAPTMTTGGTAAGTAVYIDGVNPNPTGPADINNAGGLSPLGTMAQNGNAAEWVESGWIPPNDDPAEIRVMRGGAWSSSAAEVSAVGRNILGPAFAGFGTGFRIASVVDTVAGSISISNPMKLGNTATADIESTVGNVDIYRSYDLIDFGVAPVTSDLAPGIGVVIDSTATADRAFYRAVSTGAPPP